MTRSPGLLVGLVGCAALVASAPPVGAIFASTQAPTYKCSLVIGFSQTDLWFGDAFKSAATSSAEWEELFYPGGGVENWQDPTYDGWSADLQTPCAASDPTRPDRVVFTITSADDQADPNWWIQNTSAALTTLKSMYPSASTIALQPVVGGPNDSQCFADNGVVVKATFNDPVIDSALPSLLGGGVVAGAKPEVFSCDDFYDDVGHFNAEVQDAIGAQIGAFYAGSQAPTARVAAAPVGIVSSTTASAGGATRVTRSGAVSTLIFTQPKHVVQLRASNSGATPAQVTLTCEGQAPSLTWLQPRATALIQPGWQGGCRTLTLSHSAGAHVRLSGLKTS